MECVNRWAAQEGHSIKPYGVDISRKLADLARRRLPQWQDRIFVGNAFLWSAPFRFDFVRTEMAYVPHHLRQQYAERLLEEVVAPGDVSSRARMAVQGQRAVALKLWSRSSAVGAYP